jgi:hypothetical protein
MAVLRFCIYLLRIWIQYEIYMRVRIHTVSRDADPAGSEIICNLGSGSVINSGSGFGSGSKLSSVSIQSCTNVQI